MTMSLISRFILYETDTDLWIVEFSIYGRNCGNISPSPYFSRDIDPSLQYTLLNKSTLMEISCVACETASPASDIWIYLYRMYRTLTLQIRVCSRQNVQTSTLCIKNILCKNLQIWTDYTNNDTDKPVWNF